MKIGRTELEKQIVVVLFPLANDVQESSLGVWTEIGPNSKERINSIWYFDHSAWPSSRLVWLFSAGTDGKHSAGRTLAELGNEYVQQHFEYVSRYPDGNVVNHDNKVIFGTKPEFIWGMRELLKLYPPNKYILIVVMATQRRHMPRVKWIVKRYGPREVFFHFLITSQTKELPFWRETLSWVKLYLGDGWLGKQVQRFRRSMTNSFDRA